MCEGKIFGDDAIQALTLCFIHLDLIFRMSADEGLDVWWVERGDNGRLTPPFGVKRTYRSETSKKKPKSRRT
jgi:hypothetical protein